MPNGVAARQSLALPHEPASAVLPAGVTLLSGVLVCILVASTSIAHAEADPSRVRRLLSLLRGIEQEYREAFDEQGTVVRPVELEEVALLLVEARDAAQQLAATAPAGLTPRIAALAARVHERAPVALILAASLEIRSLLADATGVVEDIYPTEPPSAELGAPVYQTSCASCHGPHGAGDGPDAARSQPRPADFNDHTFMRNETPADFFLVISLGRRRTSMPAWEDALSVQERWDLVSFLWSLRAEYRDMTAARQLFLAQCALCHMPAAVGPDSGTPANATAFNAFDRMAGRTDAELERAISDSPAHLNSADEGAISDQERTKLVAFIRTLSLGEPAPGEVGRAARGVHERSRLESALQRVEERVNEALNAYRLREDRAASIAADAYLAFEPLEIRIAARDPSLVRRAEAEFIRLQKAMRQPESIKEVEEAAAGVRRALADARQRTGKQANATASFWIAATVVASTLLVFAWWRR
jgi:mono/diheme cytochrome c family protein